MEKPTIFLSHSSSDREYILKLKNIITKRTSKTIEVFQSSDGESIPFGNNWVHKIEENLNKTKIMLVFVSPKSASSSWIYFESGFAYAKGVKVIPIGISGIDIGSIKPPLNLLQGFNISSEGGLGNLITVINREFHTEFDDQFSPTDFAELSIFDYSKERNRVPDQVEEIKIELYRKIGQKGDQSELSADCISKIEKHFQSFDIQYRINDNSINGTMPVLTSHGIKITRDGEGSIKIVIATDSIAMYEPLINELHKLYDKEQKRGWLRAIPANNYKLVTSSIKLSSKLHKHGYELAEMGHGFYSLDDWNLNTFKHDNTDGPNNILINFPAGTFKTESLYRILDDLIEAKVIYQ